MDLVAINSTGTALAILLGFVVIIFGANWMDYSVRLMAERKAEEAEAERFRKWGLPPAKHRN